MKVEWYIQWEVKDKNGQLKSYKKHKANSTVRSMIDLMYSLMSEAAYTNGGKDTSNATQSPTHNAATNFYCNALAGNALYGLVVGSGTNAVTINDYALQTLIAHGVGAGQLSYGAMNFVAPAVAGSTKSFTLVRIFTNSSGSDITVNEIGIYVKSNTIYYCIERSLSTQVIPNTLTGTLTYTCSVTV